MPFNTARQLVAALYGDELVSNLNGADFTVGTTVVQIASRDAAVIARTISNNGAAAIFVSSLAGVSANTGIAVNPGATLVLSAREDFDLAWCSLFAISAGAGNAVHVASTQLVGSQL